MMGHFCGKAHESSDEDDNEMTFHDGELSFQLEHVRCTFFQRSPIDDVSPRTDAVYTVRNPRTHRK